MKKILSLLAAGAIALGLIGCSGDLHDAVVTKINLTESLKVIGSNSGWTDATAPSITDNGDGSYTAVVVADAVNVQFCLAEDSDSWKNQTGGDLMKGDVSAVVNGFGVYNAKTKDLQKGSTYNFKFTPDVDGKILVEITEAKEPKYFLLDGYFIRSLDSGWNGTASNLLWNPIKDPATGNVVYKVEFTATAETQQLALARQSWDSGRYECSVDTSFAVGAEPITLESGKDKHPVVTGLIVGRPYNVVIETTVDEGVTMTVEQIKYIDVVGLKVINADEYEGKSVYFLEGWIPENDWGKTTPNNGIVTDGTVEISIELTRLTIDSIPLQMTAPEDADNGFWDIKVGGGTKNVNNVKDFKKYIIQYDCEADKLTLVEKNS